MEVLISGLMNISNEDADHRLRGVEAHLVVVSFNNQQHLVGGGPLGARQGLSDKAGKGDFETMAVHQHVSDCSFACYDVPWRTEASMSVFSSGTALSLIHI